MNHGLLTDRRTLCNWQTRRPPGKLHTTGSPSQSEFVLGYTPADQQTIALIDHSHFIPVRHLAAVQYSALIGRRLGMY